ncbi:MAG: hypothetical protein WC796_05640 [Candidatus Pacearchaeota archaeon]
MERSIGFTGCEREDKKSIYAPLVGEIVTVMLPGGSINVGRLTRTTELSTELCPSIVREDQFHGNEKVTVLRLERTKPCIMTTGAIVGMNPMSENYLDQFNGHRDLDHLYL